MAPVTAEETSLDEKVESDSDILKPLIEVPENLEDLIEISENPYIHFGKELTKNELCALVAGAAVTGVVNYALDRIFGGSCPPAIKAPILAGTQPISEKPALFARDAWKAWKEFKATPKHERKRIRDYVLKVWKDGWPTLRADLLYHDTAYIANMVALTYFVDPQSSLGAATMSALSFFTALAFAAVAEVKTVDFRYKLFTRKLEKMGFGSESYFEARYRIIPEEERDSPRNVVNTLREKFGLGEIYSRHYHDRYVLRSNLNRFNAWDPYIRFRERESDGGEGLTKSVQLNFTRAFEVKRKGWNPYNCVAVAKRKFYYQFKGEMPWKGNMIKDKRIRRIVEKAEGRSDYHEVKFCRMMARNPDGLLIAADVRDTSLGENLYQIKRPYWIEVKVRKDLQLLMAANDYILKKFSPDPTTKNKLELTVTSKSL